MSVKRSSSRRPISSSRSRCPIACWTLSPMSLVTRRCWPSGRRATTLSAAPPSDGRRSSTSTWNAPIRLSRPNRPACCIASHCGSIGASFIAASIERQPDFPEPALRPPEGLYFEPGPRKITGTSLHCPGLHFDHQRGVQRRHLGHRLGQSRLLRPAALVLHLGVDMFNSRYAIGARKKLPTVTDSAARQENNIARLWQ